MMRITVARNVWAVSCRLPYVKLINPDAGAIAAWRAYISFQLMTTAEPRGTVRNS